MIRKAGRYLKTFVCGTLFLVCFWFIYVVLGLRKHPED